MARPPFELPDPRVTGWAGYLDPEGEAHAGWFEICERPERVVLWTPDDSVIRRSGKRKGDLGEVIAVPRDGAPIVRGKVTASDCRCPGGCSAESHVGTCALTTTLAGATRIERGYIAGWSSIVGLDDAGGPCLAADVHGGKFAVCATRSHSVIARQVQCDRGSALGMEVVVSSVAQPGSPPLRRYGDTDPASTFPVWRLHFADLVAPVGSNTDPITLTFDLATSRASLEIGGVREDCLAFGVAVP